MRFTIRILFPLCKQFCRLCKVFLQSLLSVFASRISPMLDKMQQDIVQAIRQFVEREVLPVARGLEHADEYPHDLVRRLKELGLFGCNVPVEYGGLGLDSQTFAMIV